MAIVALDNSFCVWLLDMFLFLVFLALKEEIANDATGNYMLGTLSIH
jgi:hypothetical protein